MRRKFTARHATRGGRVAWTVVGSRLRVMCASGWQWRWWSRWQPETDTGHGVRSVAAHFSKCQLPIESRGKRTREREKENFVVTTKGMEEESVND